MIRQAESKDLHTLAQLACRLLPDHTAEEMGEAFAETIAFHLKVGFEEANRIICFTKKL